MNKLIIIYDVIKKMKGRDSVKGTLKVRGTRDKVEVFGISNTFERSGGGNHTKGKVSIESDFGGKKMKVENTFDCQGEGCGLHHKIFRHMHSSFHDCHQGAHAGGVKDALNKIMTLLGILGSIGLDEKDDGSVVLSLVSADIPEDIRKGMREHFRQHCEQRKDEAKDMDGCHQAIMKEFHGMEDIEFALKLYIGKSKEIEKASAELNGVKRDDGNRAHDMKIEAELFLG